MRCVAAAVAFAFTVVPSVKMESIVLPADKSEEYIWIVSAGPVVGAVPLPIAITFIAELPKVLVPRPRLLLPFKIIASV